MDFTDIIQVNVIFVIKVRKYITRWKDHLRKNQLLNYVFNLLKSITLFHLSSYLTIEAASFRSLVFISMFYLRTLNVLSGLKVLSGQIFWIFAAHIQKEHFASNAVMSICMTFDSDIAAFQYELLKEHFYLLFFRCFAMNQITVCIVISLGKALMQYLYRCKKSSTDLLLFTIWTYSLYTWFPKLTLFYVLTTLTLWVLFTLIR